MPEPYPCELPLPPDKALEQVAEEAQSWGGSWQAEGSGGRLTLPVIAGIRRGWVRGRVDVERNGRGSKLHFRIEDSDYQIQRGKVAVLLAAAAGALAILAAPLVPALIPLVPLSAMLMLAAWLFIVSGLRNSGPEEFFETLTEEAEGINEADRSVRVDSGR